MIPSSRPRDGTCLALETSGPIGSVAVGSPGVVLARSFLPAMGEQASGILPAVESVLDTARLRRHDLEGVVVGAGPGSFTGVRIAAATAKGIAHALDVPLWAFSSLAAAALSDRVLPPGTGPGGWWKEVNGEAGPVRYVLFDARGDRVYAGCYLLRDGGAGVEILVPPHPARVGELLAASAPPRAVFAGDGAVRHRDRLAALGHPVLGPPAGTPTADALLHLLASDHALPLADPARWEPDYLRGASAEPVPPGRPHPPGGPCL